MVGGKSDKRVTGLSMNRLEIYNIENDSWSQLQINTQIWEVPSGAGLVQVTDNDLLVFGGVVGERKVGGCWRVEFREGVVRVQKCPELYSESTFSNPSLVHRQQVIALQNSGRGTTKHLLRFSGQSWKFVSC